MAFSLVPDELWREIEPLLPVHKPSKKGGRPRLPDRSLLSGIIFVLKSGIPWNMLPPEFGCGDGTTCWRRLHEWTLAGVWKRVHQRLLHAMGRLGMIDWSRAVIDSASVRAVFGGSTPAPTPQIEPNGAVNATS
jgi:transposase